MQSEAKEFAVAQTTPEGFGFAAGAVVVVAVVSEALWLKIL